MRIRWSLEARADIAAIHRYYRRRDPAYALRVSEMAVRAARFLAHVPGAGPIVEGSDKHKWRIAGTRHILLYRSDGDVLRIVRVVDASQNWRELLI